MIRRDLTQRAEDFNIILDDVSITELSFGREYTSAVEAKQVNVVKDLHTEMIDLLYINLFYFDRSQLLMISKMMLLR